MSLRIALATCSELPELDPDDQPLVQHFAEAGIEATPVIWSDDNVEWSRFDRVIVRNTWDYTEHHAQFLQWVASQSGRIRNSPDTITWNSVKTYVSDLARANIPVIETQFIRSREQGWLIPQSDDFVVKPTVSAGSKNTIRLATEDPASRVHAEELIAEIVDSGKIAMIQPYLDLVDSQGETALLYIGGQYSHAIRKGPLLRRNQEVEHVHGLYLQEEISPREPRSDQRSLADQVVNFVTERWGSPLYARIDLLDDPSGEPRVLEVELVEPSMFFATAPQSYVRFVTAASL